LPVLCATSVFLVSLWWPPLIALQIHHKDTESTEVAQRKGKLLKH